MTVPSSILIKKGKGKAEDLEALVVPIEHPAQIAKAKAALPKKSLFCALVNFLCLMIFTLGLTMLMLYASLTLIRAIRLHHFRGQCGIRYPRLQNMIPASIGDELNVDNIQGLKRVVEQDVTMEKLSLVEKLKNDGTIEFDYELDLEFEEFESFEMPEISRGRYFHDFIFNKTIIVDFDGNRCFVMDLDYDHVPRPKDTLDMLQKMIEGRYNVDIDTVRVETRVVLPPMTNLKEEAGNFATEVCRDKITYQLVPVDDFAVAIVKRSVDESATPFQFIEFTGKAIIKYNILNLADLS